VLIGEGWHIGVMEFAISYLRTVQPTPEIHVSHPWFRHMPLSRDRDLNLNTSFDVDDDLLDDLGGSVQVNEPLCFLLVTILST